MKNVSQYSVIILLSGHHIINNIRKISIALIHELTSKYVDTIGCGVGVTSQLKCLHAHDQQKI